MGENLMAEPFVLFDLAAENQQQVMRALQQPWTRKGGSWTRKGMWRT